MEIRRLTTVQDRDIEAITDFMRVIAAADSPWLKPMSPSLRKVFMEHGWDGEPPIVYVGEQEGALVAVGHLELPERDNRHLAWADVKVHPGRRRHGLGSELFHRLETDARAAGRTSIGSSGWESDASVGFATKHGLGLRSQTVVRRIHNQEIDPGVLAKQIDQALAAAADYELLRVFGRTPDDLIEQAVAITGAINDAPTDDLDIEDEVFTVERQRAYEEANLATGRPYTIYARHKATGALAGKTVVLVRNDDPAIGLQHDTSVVREHRGHRLGLLLKASMLQWLAEAEPQLHHVDTENAETNAHMISVNEQLGFVVLGRELEFQRDL